MFGNMPSRAKLSIDGTPFARKCPAVKAARPPDPPKPSFFPGDLRREWGDRRDAYFVVFIHHAKKRLFFKPFSRSFFAVSNGFSLFIKNRLSFQSLFRQGFAGFSSSQKDKPFEKITHRLHPLHGRSATSLIHKSPQPRLSLFRRPIKLPDKGHFSGP